MTEERFEYNHMEGFKPYIYDVNDNHMVDDLEIICELLNQLSNEIEELKSKLNESKKAHSRCDKLWWELHDEKEQLEKENEQLKQKYRKLQIDFNDVCAIVYDLRESKLDLEDENEELKFENRRLKEDLEHCANQFTDDGKNLLLSLR